MAALMKRDNSRGGRRGGHETHGLVRSGHARFAVVAAAAAGRVVGYSENTVIRTGAVCGDTCGKKRCSRANVANDLP